MTRPHAPDLDVLRRRTSEKWSLYPDDVLPLFVAEMDYQVAPFIADALIEQIRCDDLGYVAGAGDVGEAFAGFAARRWGWSVDPSGVSVTTDVSVVIAEALRVMISPGDTVVITSPVYPPFFDLVVEAGGRVADVPLAHGRLDLAEIAAALADGARAVLLCHPHNPLGHSHSREELVELAALAQRHGALVLSDEIHAPLVYDPGFVPFLSCGAAARSIGVAAHSASKAFNLAGVKCALTVTASEPMRAMIARQPEEVTFRTSILGRTATSAAYRLGDDWLDATVEEIRAGRDLLGRLLDERLPLVRWTPPAASYLAWLDFRGYPQLGDDPASTLLETAGVALQAGPPFGPSGVGFARLNFACSPQVLTEAVERIAATATVE
ncbi:aminotransferase class I/II-fold pyridoxal phosphate-dependent enzyme [Gordonia sp. TBRC 11910]|uniref:cysteine-S-conjugate beta-lyase n=1 Tax=Gordonia asplenii TaxID=2725283 RepID=A0A848L4D7_9ACTN|nr:aminotransferase class I/II-fold pyridoxal phosphate-dependent enzyme [Gordonia asplenii]NMO03451.1 aminotransferase class I/II-fold pyridoxal phosphate-dependent enzyme [Gordonia asplenii]